MSSPRPYQKTYAFGADTVKTLGSFQTGIPTPDWGAIQVYCTGLDGGTWALDLLREDGSVNNLATGQAESATYAGLETPPRAHEGIVVTLSGLGAGKAPVLHFALFGRTLRYAVV